MVRAYQQLVETLWTPMKKKEKKVKSNMKQATKLNYKLLKISEVKIDKLEEEDKEEHLFKTVELGQLGQLMRFCPLLLRRHWCRYQWPSADS